MPVFAQGAHASHGIARSCWLPVARGPLFLFHQLVRGQRAVPPVYTTTVVQFSVHTPCKCTRDASNRFCANFTHAAAAEHQHACHAPSAPAAGVLHRSSAAPRVARSRALGALVGPAAALPDVSVVPRGARVCTEWAGGTAERLGEGQAHALAWVGVPWQSAPPRSERCKQQRARAHELGTLHAATSTHPWA